MPAQIPNGYTGTSWENIRVQLVYAFDAANGHITVGGVMYPRATNAQALALMQSWRGLLRAFKLTVPASHFPELWFRAFGYVEAGDKFDMSTAHGASPAPDLVVAGAWEFARRAAELLDGKRAQPRVLGLNFSRAGYEKAAADAYSELKKLRAKSKTPAKKITPPMPPGIDPPVVTPAPIPTPPLPTIPSTDRGTALLVLLVLVAIATAKRKGK